MPYTVDHELLPADIYGDREVAPGDVLVDMRGQTAAGDVVVQVVAAPKLKVRELCILY